MPDLIRHPGLFSGFRVEPGMTCNTGGFILIRNWLSPKKHSYPHNKKDWYKDKNNVEKYGKLKTTLLSRSFG